jgi:hypothetical protein
MSELGVLRTFDNYIVAHIVKAKLEDDGILCFLKDENVVTAWSGAVGRIQLLIPEGERERAEALLQYDEAEAKKQRETPGFWEEDTEQLSSGNRVCLHCGSRNTRRKEDEKDSPFLSWLFSKFSSKKIQSETWHCFHCGDDF